jgi:Mg-chelatase subunit ChlD
MVAAVASHSTQIFGGSIVNPNFYAASSFELQSPWLGLAGIALASLWTGLPWLSARFDWRLVGPGAGLNRARRRWTAAIRWLSLSALVLALAGLRHLSTVEGQSVVFLVDRSLSCRDQEDKIREYLGQVVAKLGPAQQIGVISFGKDAGVEFPPTRPPALPKFTVNIDAQGTDIASALRFAYASMPSDRNCRVVVISDGRATSGQAREEAEASAQLGIEVSSVLLDKPTSQEVLLESLQAPSQIQPDSPFELKITAVSNQSDVEALLVVEAQSAGQNEARTVISRETVKLQKGKNLFVIPQRSPASTVLRYSAHLESKQDSEPANNRAQTAVVVTGPSKVLYISARGAGTDASSAQASQQLQKALVASGIKVESIYPDQLPTDLADWQAYSAIVLDDISSEQFAPVQLDWLAALINEMGLGLLVIGGPNSYGAGGYNGTSLAQTWPINLDIRKRKNFPRTATIEVIDKSGSMAEQEGGVEKIQLAREAAIASLEMMSPEDEMGVIGFDEAFKWVVNLQKVTAPQALAGKIATLRPGGGTSLYGGLRAAIQALMATDAPVRHILVLTDGMVEPADFKSLTKQAVDNKITISTVAVGRDADTKFLEILARDGKGKSYLANTANVLPRIFSRDIVLASRHAFIEKPVQVSETNQHPILKGLKFERPLMGYNLVAPKELPAQVLLSSPDTDPILAAGRSGIGKVVAFTGDNGARWSQGWNAGAALSQLTVQSLRWVLPEGQRSPLQCELETGNDGRRKLSVRLGTQVAELSAQAESAQVSLISPQGQIVKLPLEQTAVGEYSATLPSDQSGSWLVQVATNSPKDGQSELWSRSYAVPYSAELAAVGSDPVLMESLAKAGGGRFNPTPDQVLSAPARVRKASRELWPDLLLFSLLLLPLEVAIRRLHVQFGFKSKPKSEAAPQATAAVVPSRLLDRKREAKVNKPLQVAQTPVDIPTQPAPQPLIIEAPPKAPTPPSEAASGTGMDRLKKAKKRGLDQDNKG